MIWLDMVKGASQLKKILIADSALDFAQELAGRIDHAYSVEVCSDPDRVIESICSFRPDMLVLDLMMPGCDGIAVLHTIYALGIRPVVLVTTRVVSLYHQIMLEELNIAHLMRHPCDPDVVAARLSELSGCPRELLIPMPDDKQITQNMLYALGINREYMGFDCLIPAVAMVSIDPTISYTKVLYPDVAKLVDSSPKQVERGIRTAIVAAWEKMNPRVWEQFFLRDATGEIPQPSNSVFIKCLAKVLARQKIRK